MIEIGHVTKRYGEKVAVDDLSFVVKPGIVTGFLGPNGAGKSTTMRMILGLDEPTSGTVRVNGRAYRDLEAPLHEIGAMLEARAIHTGRSAFHHLLAMAQTHGIGRERVDEVIDLVGLGALGVGLGALVRNTAGGIAAFVGLLFVLPGITALLPHSLADSVNPYLPLNAGSAIATSTFEDRHHLSPGGGFAVFGVYTLIVIAVASVRLVRRDA